MASALLVVVCGVGALTLPGAVFGGVLVLVSIVCLGHRPLFSWTGLLVATVSIVMFVPIRRFKLPIPLPFALEPYRAILALLAVGIFISLLVDPRFSWRRNGFGYNVGFFLVTLFCSLGVNVGSLSAVGLMGTSLGALLNYLFLFGTFFVTRVLLRSARIVDVTIYLLALGGAFVGLSAAVERLTGFNVFFFVSRLVGLQMMSDNQSLSRGGAGRAFGSAQHPIALSVFLVMLLPLAVYQARHARWPRQRGQLFWIGCSILMMIGIISAVSRTSFVMLSAMVVIAVIARPGITGRLLLVGLPSFALASAIAPQTVLNMLRSFTHPSTLIASQQSDPGWRGSGRLADLGPNLQVAMIHPFFGTGIGSRIVVGPKSNALILDDQLLDVLLEVGILGMVGLIVLILLPAARLWQFSRSPSTSSRYTDLAVALLVSLAGYFVALFFFDGFGFLQTVLTFSILLAIGGWLITEVPWTRRPRMTISPAVWQAMSRPRARAARPQD